MKKDQTIGNNQTWEILAMSINCCGSRSIIGHRRLY